MSQPRPVSAHGDPARYSVVLYEVPLPSSRTRREMATLRRHGFDVSVVHNPRYVDRVAADGLATIPAYVGKPNPLLADLRRRIAAGDGAQATEAQRAQARVLAAALDLPVPQLRERPADLNVLVHNWLTAAQALATVRPHLYWAADLDALPPVVWAASLSPGSKVVFDAHELFPELDYLDPLQRDEWDDIAAAFVPHADLVLAVGSDVGDVFADRYGARRVEVVPNLAEAAAPSATTLRTALGLPADTPLAVHVGNVVANRRPELAVELLGRLPELHVAFVGEIRGGLDDVLTARAASLGVGDRLHLVPPVPGPELVSFVADADLSLILYSPRRSVHLALTMPNKLYDSLAAGLPVVSTAGLAPTRFVEAAGLGVPFADDDVAALADAVRTVLGDPSFRDRAATSRADYLWPAGEKHLLDVVESVASLAQPKASDGQAGTEPGAPATGTAGEAGRGSGAQPNAAARASLAGRVARRLRKAAAWRLRRLANRLDR